MILYLGRFHPKKGLHLLIEAFARIHDFHPKAVLCLAGNRAQFPVYTAELDRLVSRHGLQQKIVWPGFLNEAEKPNALATATVFSHVSESEGIAMAIPEALAMGLPTIVGVGCYMREAAQLGAVRECPFQAEALAQGLDSLLSSGRESLKTLGALAAQYARTHHDWERIAEKSIEAYSAAQ